MSWYSITIFCSVKQFAYELSGLRLDSFLGQCSSYKIFLYSQSLKYISVCNSWLIMEKWFFSTYHLLPWNFKEKFLFLDLRKFLVAERMKFRRNFVWLRLKRDKSTFNNFIYWQWLSHHRVNLMYYLGITDVILLFQAS